jgi:hypothetical protein
LAIWREEKEVLPQSRKARRGNKKQPESNNQKPLAMIHGQ